MALHIVGDAPSLCVRREAYERTGLTRGELDGRLGLTAEEFRVEGDLVVIGPIYAMALDELFDTLETLGLRYFDDYFELTGNWPGWLKLYAAGS
jgi:8-oxo-dGTP pyrophosphatase MutT (NUDIX family)